ncbi:MAG TPA: FAD/NAD(P)-binding protein [Acidimicrobiia bacterium]
MRESVSAVRSESPTVEPMLPRPFRVASNTVETHDVRTIRLVPDDDQPCLRFEPAQFGMIGIPGLGEVPISFSSDPDDGSHVDCTIRAAGAVTSALTSSEPGEIVTVRGPYGVPWPIHLAGHHHLLVVAGGLGLAPLRSLIVAAGRLDGFFDSLGLVYGAREPGEFLYRSELDAWADRGVDVALTVDRPSPGWDGDVGVVTTLFPAAVQHPADTAVMMCGPDVMLGAAAFALGRLGVPADQIWVTMERNMACAIGLCGHCQFGGVFICKDGPVLRYDRIARLFAVPEV